MWVLEKLKLDLELKFELRLDFSSKKDYEVLACWSCGKNVFCWLVVVVMPSLRRSLASGQKMKPPIFPLRRNLIPSSSHQIYWEQRYGGGDELGRRG